MPLPTRANPGLRCKKIKKDHELQYALKKLQEKDLNLTRKGTFLQASFKNVSQIYAACLFNA